MEIKPGSAVSIEITKLPTSDAARKTLVRLCRKDPTAVRHQRHQKTKRPSWEYWRRGGMSWHHQMKTQPPVTLRTGAKYNLRASVDVIRDLASIQKFVKVSAK